MGHNERELFLLNSTSPGCEVALLNALAGCAIPLLYVGQLVAEAFDPRKEITFVYRLTLRRRTSTANKRTKKRCRRITHTGAAALDI
jgi:hypothetical protein